MSDKDLIIQRISYNCNVCDLPISCTVLAKDAAFDSMKANWDDPDNSNHKVSLYKTRKIMRELEAEGFVVKDHFGGQNDEGYPYCIHGYVLTDLGKEKLEIYKKVSDKIKQEFDAWVKDVIRWLD